MHPTQAPPVRLKTVRRQRHPTIVHAQGHQDFLRDKPINHSTIDAPNDLPKDQPTREQLVTGALARSPSRLDWSRTDGLNRLVPGQSGLDSVSTPKARGMIKEVANDNLLLSMLAELRNIRGNRRVQIEKTGLPQQGDGHGGQRFAGG